MSVTLFKVVSIKADLMFVVSTWWWWTVSDGMNADHHDHHYVSGVDARVGRVRTRGKSLWQLHSHSPPWTHIDTSTHAYFHIHAYTQLYQQVYTRIY